MTAANVSTGKPKVAGAVFTAPKGTTLPTTADATLDNAFVDLGYVSEDGVTNNYAPETDNTKAWGGDVVLINKTEQPDEWTLTLIEALNVNVLKTVYGSANVTSGTGGVISVSAKTGQPAEASYVIDMALKGGAMKRVVIPCGVVADLGDIVYKDDEPIGYEITIGCLPDSSSVTHYEYIKPASSST